MSSERKKNFGNRLKKVRCERQKSVEEVAEKAGISPKSLYAYEAGKTVPGADVLEVISTFLDYDFAPLLTSTEPETIPAEAKSTIRSIAQLTVELDTLVRVSIPVFGPEGLAAAEAILDRVLAKCVTVKPTQTEVADPGSDMEKEVIARGFAGGTSPKVAPVPQHPTSVAESNS